jgi:hypothetical protein
VGNQDGVQGNMKGDREVKPRLGRVDALDEASYLQRDARADGRG